MFFSSAKRNHERRFIDLIKDVSAARWPNWDPGTKLNAGDFGTVDKKTGKLKIEGNIYTHDAIKEIAKEYMAVQGAALDYFQIQSYQMDAIDMGIDTNANVGQNIVFHVGFTVNTNSGAILVMHKPRMIYIPDAFFMASSSKDISILKGKVVVHQTWECPGFSMYYFSGKRHQKFTVTLRENINPSADQPNFSWVTDGSVSHHQQAYQHEPRELFTPLFRLWSMRHGHHFGG